MTSEQANWELTQAECASRGWVVRRCNFQRGKLSHDLWNAFDAIAADITVDPPRTVAIQFTSHDGGCVARHRRKINGAQFKAADGNGLVLEHCRLLGWRVLLWGFYYKGQDVQLREEDLTPAPDTPIICAPDDPGPSRTPAVGSSRRSQRRSGRARRAARPQ